MSSQATMSIPARLLYRWHFGRVGHIELHGCMDDLSPDDIADVIDTLLIVKRQCARLGQKRAVAELDCAGDIPLEKKS